MIGTVALALGFVALLAPEPPAAAAQPALRVSGPYVFENLDVYLLHGTARRSARKPTPLARALQQGKVVVSETGNVSELTIENRSDEEVYVQAGEIVKGGRQDRVLGSDMLLPPRSGKVKAASFCVEHGRWQQRPGEAADRFSSSQAHVAHKELRIAQIRGSQQEVWDSVDRVQSKLAANLGGSVRAEQSSSSLQLTLEHERVRKGVADYVSALSGVVASHADAVGYAFAVNGAISAADVYASHALFAELWPKLLHASAVEAVAEARPGAAAHTPPTLRSIAGFLVEAERGAASRKPAAGDASSVVRETATTLLVETRHRTMDDASLHKSYVRK
jgi:hypothetical protein